MLDLSLGGSYATRKAILMLAVLVVLAVAPVLSFAQDAPAPSFTPEQLDKLVARIALYPDSLLAQVLAAATYSDQIPDAARWADQHHYLTGQALANAIQADHLPWDPSVQALLPFPSVLEMMANDMSWTTDLGNAFLSQQQDVMDAVQRERKKARDYGYLRSNAQIIVSDGPYITIVPVHPAFVPVPYYDPAIVFFPPEPGIVRRRRDPLWLLRDHRGFLSPVGLGILPLRLGLARSDHQQRTLAADLDQPARIRSSLPGPAIRRGRAASRAARAARAHGA